MQTMKSAVFACCKKLKVDAVSAQLIEQPVHRDGGAIVLRVREVTIGLHEPTLWTWFSSCNFS